MIHVETNRSYVPLLLLEADGELCTRADTICFLSRALTLDILTVDCQIYGLFLCCSFFFFPLIDDLVGSPNDSGIIIQPRLKKPGDTNCLFNSQ